jgi:hypothetical protein
MSVAKGRTLKETYAAVREAMDPKFGSFAAASSTTAATR